MYHILDTFFLTLLFICVTFFVKQCNEKCNSVLLQHVVSLYQDNQGEHILFPLFESLAQRNCDRYSGDAGWYSFWVAAPLQFRSHMFANNLWVTMRPMVYIRHRLKAYSNEVCYTLQISTHDVSPITSAPILYLCICMI